MKFNNFTILHYGKYYNCVKICSVTKKEYKVKLSWSDFMKYYPGKTTKHLTKYSEDDILFLETTLTPEEIKLLTPQQKKVRKTQWKFQLLNNLNK